MDFKDILSSTTQYNFHSHTQFCDGKASMEDMARRAVLEGMKHYGFTPHSPILIESPCNMDQAAAPTFMQEVERLKQLPELHACKFYAGMEIDYMGAEWGPSHPFFANLNLDYSIGSVHFIPTQDGRMIDIDGRFQRFCQKMKEDFRNDIEYVVHMYYSNSCDMVRAGGFDIIGHFDKIGHNASHFAPGIEDSRFYRDEVEKLIETLNEYRPIVEINTKAYTEFGRFFPNKEHIYAVRDCGLTLMVNSDAHRPDGISAGRKEGLELLR